MDNTEAEGVAWYSGIEPVEIGNLDDVKETKTIIPATKGVRIKIVKAENAVNKENTYRSINLIMRIINGIDAEGKYKNKSIFGRVCYFADPIVYTKDFFKTKQHLVQLKHLFSATGITERVVNGYTFDRLMSAPEIKVDITVKKRIRIMQDENGQNTEVEELENEVRNYKALDITEQV